MKNSEINVGNVLDTQLTQEIQMSQLNYSVYGYHYSRRVTMFDRYRDVLLNGTDEDACELIRGVFVQLVDGLHHIDDVLALSIDGRELLPFSGKSWADGVESVAMKNLRNNE